MEARTRIENAKCIQKQCFCTGEHGEAWRRNEEERRPSQSDDAQVRRRKDQGGNLEFFDKKNFSSSRTEPRPLRPVKSSRWSPSSSTTSLSLGDWPFAKNDTSPFCSLRNMKLSGTSASSATACRLWRPWTRCLACSTFSRTKTTFTRLARHLSLVQKTNNISKVETVKDCFVGVAGAPEK